MQNANQFLKIGNKEFKSRLLIGTGKYSSLEIMQKNRRIDSTLQIITCVHEDSEKAVERAKKTLAFYISVGEIYRTFLSNNGYQNEVDTIYNEYTTSGLKNSFKLVTDKMVKDLCICGTPSESQQKLKEFKGYE